MLLLQCYIRLDNIAIRTGRLFDRDECVCVWHHIYYYIVYYCKVDFQTLFYTAYISIDLHTDITYVH